MKKPKVVSIPGVRIEKFGLIIVGDTPLLCNRLAPEITTGIEDDQTGKAKGKKPPRDPEKEYENSLYVSREGWYGFPAAGIKAACIECATRFNDDLYGTEARGAFFVIAQSYERDTGADLVKIEGEPEMHRSMVRLKNGSVIPRYRAAFQPWRISFEVRFNPDYITCERLANLVELTGFHVGIGDWRPAAPKGNSGMHGMFHLQREE